MSKADPHPASGFETVSEQDARMLAALLQMTSDGIIIVDREQRILFFNAGAEAIFRIKGDEAIGKALSAFLPERNRTRHDTLFEAFLGSPVATRMMSERTEVCGLRGDGTEFPAEISIARIQIDDELYLAATIRDISRRKALELQLKDKILELEKAERRSRHGALHDSLTGLPNRANFQSTLARTLERSRLEGAAIMFLDLDGFKEVNDTMGHAAGDELLRLVGRRLASALRAGDGLFRLGGDEFTVVLPKAEEPQAAEVAGRLVRLLEEPFEIAGRPVSVSTSIGIASWPADGEDATEVMRAADIAMYRAKAAGGNGFRFFKMSTRVDGCDAAG